jgi:predicted negative regulator of RcsB-dependent stress response
VEDYLSEKERWEWVRAQVRENAPAVILAAVVVLGSLAGWRWWQDRQDAARMAAGSRYMSMVEAIDHGDHAQAMRLLGELERDSAGSAYTDQAKMLAARVYLDAGELDKAATELSAVAAQSKDHNLASVARLRLARVQVAQGKADAALATLGATDTTAFAGRSFAQRTIPDVDRTASASLATSPRHSGWTRISTSGSLSRIFATSSGVICWWT